MSAMLKQVRSAVAAIGAVAFSGIGVASCITFDDAVPQRDTKFFDEGPGQPSDRASGTVPYGQLGVCRVPDSSKPPYINETLWNEAKPCTSRTPPKFVRLGYEPSPVTDARVKRMTKIIGDAPRNEKGQLDFAFMVRALKTEALKDPALRERVARDSRPVPCDMTYLLNTMNESRARLTDGNKCTAEAYDTKQRHEVCVFDEAKTEATWLTSSWDCATHTGTIGHAQSCHRLCAYDDYCAKQVSCTAPELDLILCAMGICIPEAGSGLPQ